MDKYESLNDRVLTPEELDIIQKYADRANNEENWVAPQGRNHSSIIISPNNSTFRPVWRANDIGPLLLVAKKLVGMKSIDFKFPDPLEVVMDAILADDIASLVTADARLFDTEKSVNMIALFAENFNDKGFTPTAETPAWYLTPEGGKAQTTTVIEGYPSLYLQREKHIDELINHHTADEIAAICAYSGPITIPDEWREKLSEAF